MSPVNNSDSDDSSHFSVGPDTPNSGGNLSSNTGSSFTGQSAVVDDDGGGADGDLDECFICGDGGELIICDAPGCEKAYHAECVNVDINTLPLAWFCPDCCTHPANKSTTTPTVVDDDNAVSGTTTVSNPVVTVAGDNDTAPRTPTKTSRTANKKISNRDSIIRTPTYSPAKPSSTPSSFKMVTVPKGVNPGDVFHVLIPSEEGDNTKKEVVIGVICPRGVRAGDSIIVLEPGNIHPLVSPEEIVKINRRLFARDDGRGGIDQGPSTPSCHEEEEEEEGLLAMMDSAIIDAFWEVLWPFLKLRGWSCDRQLHYDFGAVKFSPPTSILKASKTEERDTFQYFHSLRGIRTYISGDDKYSKALDDFDMAIVRRKKAVMARFQQQQRRQSHRTPDAWKCLRNRKHIRVGKDYQVTQPLSRAGTNVPGEGARYTGEQIWNKTTSKPPTLAPSIWYEWAEDPNLLDQFHTAIMESKKQMNVLALAISKPVNFCLWYYYHEYKTSKNKKLYEALKKMMIDEMSTQNSNECAICNGGGEILCCDTCPEAFHLACLGLIASDIDGVENWSCPTCKEKWKLHLSPCRSPKKKRRREDE